MRAHEAYRPPQIKSRVHRLAQTSREHRTWTQGPPQSDERAHRLAQTSSELQTTHEEDTRSN